MKRMANPDDIIGAIIYLSLMRQNIQQVLT